MSTELTIARGMKDVATSIGFLFAPAILTFFFLESFVAIQALTAWQDGFFSVDQMNARGFKQGLPFVWHFAMWSDLIVISPIASYLTGKHSASWNNRSFATSLLFGLAIAAFMSWTYTLSSIPSVHIQNHKLTVAGAVHGLYMGISAAIFIQFIFFTNTTSKKSQVIVASALFLHTFVGTHMVLGVINELEHYTWYSDRPLRSIAGWSIIAIFGLLLIHKSIGILYALRLFFVDFWAWYFVARYKTDEQFLDFIHNLCTVLGTTYFVGLITNGVYRGEGALSLMLLITIAAVFTLSRRSVKEELGIVRGLFPQDNVPTEFSIKHRFSIAGQVIVFMLTYFLVGRFTSNIVISSALFFIISGLDYNIGRQILQRMRQYLTDSKFYPTPTDPSYGIILERRKVANWFLFELPRLRKEALRVIGCGLAFMASIVHYAHDNMEAIRVFSYIALITTLVLNEAVMFYWRAERSARLNACVPGNELFASHGPK